MIIPGRVADVVRRRRGELTLIFWMNTLYVLSQFQRVAVPGTVFNEIQHGFGISSAAVGALAGMYLYLYGGMQVITGMLADRFGPGRVVLAGGCLLSLGAVLFPLSHTVAMMYASRMLVAMGDGLLYVSLVKDLDLRFSDKSFSAALSWVVLAGGIGGLLGTRPFAGAVQAIGWRESLLVASGVTVLCTLICGVFLGRSSELSSPRAMTAPVWHALRSVAGSRRSYPTVVALSLCFAVYFVMQAVIGKKFLEDCCGFTPERASMYTLVLGLSATAMSILVGFISGLIGHRRKPIIIAMSMVSVAAFLMTILAMREHQGLLLLCYVLIGASCGIGPMCTANVKELNRPGYAGTATGLLNTSVYFAVACSTVVAGLVLDHFKGLAVRSGIALRYPPEAYRTFFLGCLAMGIISLILTLFIRETAGVNASNSDPQDDASQATAATHRRDPLSPPI